MRLSLPRLNIPKPLSIELRNFTLYDKSQAIGADFGSGVFCLAGANGLGKSTFLAALNYAITGVVAHPQRKFESADEYLSKSLSYSERFFEGRIGESDHETAEVELTMLVGTTKYRLVRGMFSPRGLRSLAIERADGVDDFRDSDDLADEDRQRIYEESVTADVGLGAYSQLAFLQHFVLTFDERRRLIFWDDVVAQSALFLAFGIGTDTVKRAETLRRTAERAGSLARNRQFQRTTVQNNLKSLLDAADNVDDAASEVADQYLAMTETLDELATTQRRLNDDLRDVQVSRADTAARSRASRDEYERLFADLVAGTGPVDQHPAVRAVLEKNHCGVCGTQGEMLATVVAERIDRSLCPLCDSPIAERHSEVGSAELARVDSEVQALATESEFATESETRLESRLQETAQAIETQRAAISDLIDSTDGDVSVVQPTDPASLSKIVDEYEAQMEELANQRDKQRKKRERARKELRGLQQELVQSYSLAEDDFVPRFARLAQRFLGIDLDISLDLGDSLRLIVAIDGKKRRGPDTLSESQRFFVDIALRMALAQQMSAEESPACLYIDTPEGSLDIAYEARAGMMFGEFATDGYQIIMTANINTSEMLVRLANTCGRDHMILHRMTSWTSLSDVQVKEEKLFDKAYAAIEKALDSGR